MSDLWDQIQTGDDWTRAEHLRESRRCGWCAEERPCVYVIMFDAFFCSPEHRDKFMKQTQKPIEKSKFMKLPSRDQLVKRKQTTLADMQSKMEAEDWHGVQDCGSDLREIDAQIDVLDGLIAAQQIADELSKHPARVMDLRGVKPLQEI